VGLSEANIRVKIHEEKKNSLKNSNKMDSNIDFKDLWSKPNRESARYSSELLVRLKQFKNKASRKLILTNILLVATIGFIAFIWYAFQPELITTK
jgi:hypothetical protein